MPLTDVPLQPQTRPCRQCGEPFELGRTDFFRLEYMEHGIWTTAILCSQKCLRRFARGPLLSSEARTANQPNRESKS